MIEFLDFIAKYSSVITLFLVIAAGIWGGIKFQIYLKDKRFNNFHRLVKELVDSEGTPKRDRQTAIIFELRNFPNYYDFTKRMLIDLKKSWYDNNDSDPVIREIDLTLEYISKWYRVILF